MKKSLSFIIIFCLLTGFYPAWMYGEAMSFENGIENYELRIEDQENLKELKIKEVETAKYAFKTLDEGVVEIGTEKHSLPQPYLRLEKWDGEVSLKVNIPYKVEEKPISMGDKIRYFGTNQRSLTENKSWWQKLLSIFTVRAEDSQPKIAIDFYPRQPEEVTETINGQTHTFTQNEDGGVEFDTILYEKPNTNQIVFPIETQGLKFYYQPELTQQEIDEGAFRPENVVGSYAVFHESKSGDYRALGGKNYKAGKAFHIYRPKITDAEGNEIWGELNIDVEVGTLTINIDQNWLDKAVYPVTVDPNFGYEGTGGTADVGWCGWLVGCKFSGAAGTGNSISVYAKLTSTAYGAKNYHHALYDASDNLVGNGITDQGSVNSTTPAWLTQNFISSPTLTAQTYRISTESSATGFPFAGPAYVLYYDSGTTDQFGKGIHVYGSFPADFPSGSSEDKLYFMYVTYEAAGVSAPTVTNSTGESNVAGTTARLNGEVTATGGENPTVHIYWGDNDGGTTVGNWDNDENLGIKAAETFYKDISSLTRGTNYYYRSYATNTGGIDWADSTESFTTFSGAEMSSNSYRLWESSINVGGHSQTSTSYRMRDTIGEFVAGTATSTSYKLRMGYQPMLESYISLSISTTSIQLLPNIGGVTGGTATGSYAATVLTDNPGGYSFYVNAGTSPALKSGSYSFSDYTPASAGTPDYIWSILATASEFGFTSEGTDITQKFKDNGSDACATSTSDTVDKCWYGFSTSAENIALSYSSNHPSGTQTTIKLQAEAGSSRMQEMGDYQAVITTTVLAN